MMNISEYYFFHAKPQSSQEIAALLAVADHDLLDCRTSGLNPDWQLNIAYNAALQTATAALAASGYRAVQEAHHYRVIQSFAYTIKADVGLIALLLFDQFRKKRNISGYDHAGMISDQTIFAKRLKNGFMKTIWI